METYLVTVNGVTYEVAVEKKESGSGNPGPGPQVAVAPVAAAAPAPPVPAAAVPSKGKAVLDGEAVPAGAAGKVWKIVAKEGQALQSGDPILILEAMKMEIPVVAPRDCVVTGILAAEGQAVEAGETLATIR